MIHDIDICDTCAMSHKSDIQECVTLWHKETIWRKKVQKSYTKWEKCKICQKGKKYDTFEHFDTSMTPKKSYN
jgi:hypothetical protein